MWRAAYGEAELTKQTSRNSRDFPSFRFPFPPCPPPVPFFAPVSQIRARIKAELAAAAAETALLEEQARGPSFFFLL